MKNEKEVPEMGRGKGGDGAGALPTDGSKASQLLVLSTARDEMLDFLIDRVDKEIEAFGAELAVLFGYLMPSKAVTIVISFHNQKATKEKKLQSRPDV